MTYQMGCKRDPKLIYISDWNYRYGEEKMIFERKTNSGDVAIAAQLDALQNNVNVDVLTYSTTDGTSAGNSNVQGPAPILHQCTVDNVPIQRWVNLTMSYDGSSSAKGMRLFLDGQPLASEVKYDTLTNKIAPNGENILVGAIMRDKGLKGAKLKSFHFFETKLDQDFTQIISWTSTITINPDTYIRDIRRILRLA